MIGACVHISLANGAAERRDELGAVTQMIVACGAADDPRDELGVADGAFDDGPPAELAISTARSAAAYARGPVTS